MDKIPMVSTNVGNGQNPYGINECWHLKDAQLVDKEEYLSSSAIKPTKIKTLNCWRKRR